MHKMKQTSTGSVWQHSAYTLRLIFLLVNSFGFVTIVSSILSNETDFQALSAIRALISKDPSGVMSSWNHSTHFCNWHGVICGRHQRVTSLNLSSLNLVGFLSPHIGNLTFLRTLNIGNNTFGGAIPPDIGRLHRLQFLLLNDNSFQGELPANLTRCLSLKILFAKKNNLGGKIPNQLDSLPHLYQFYIGYNHFTGKLPLSMGNLSNLLWLSLYDNDLEGSVPSEFGHLSKLELIVLGANKFSGMIPSSLYNISSINFFYVSFNNFQGILPQDLGLTLPKLKQFYASNNQLSGPIPSSLANASQLENFECNANSLSGPLPTSFGVLGNLTMLRISGNKLGDGEGSGLSDFINSLSNCSSLEELDISDNGLRGPLPISISNLPTKLNKVELGANKISGSIPLGIGKLVNLERLGLSSNMLTGSIPETIGKISGLEGLDLSLNKISGNIPLSIGNLTRLVLLNLESNMLEGVIPTSFGSCISLQRLSLSYNYLAGVIPKELVQLSSLSLGLFLKHNHLRGSIPLQISNLKNIQTIDMSENQLSGKIPTTLGSCQLLEFLYMQGNLLEGTIPTPLSQLRGIQVMDFSRNNLSGQVPRFLAELRFIQILNLSYNRFEGEVPTKGVFKNGSEIFIEGNSKLCGGIEDLHLPACPSKKQPLNCGMIIILVVLSIVLLLVCLLAILYRKRRSRQTTSLRLPLQNQYLQLTYEELFYATNGFSSTNLIGEGRYGCVYKGILNSIEQIVAVKVLKLQEPGGQRSFLAECEALRNIRHRNLVKIITSCSSSDFRGHDFRALVFEFMENGNLESWLHPVPPNQHDFKNLNFIQRLNIAIDVAAALDYLHHECQITIIHCDLKPSNVLLDNYLCAHVSDFGLTKILSANTSIIPNEQSSSIGIRGTIGYVAPEYGMSQGVSTQGDMYSYGVLLLEMFTGKRPTNNMFSDHVSLRSYVKLSIPNRVMEVVDSQIILEEEGQPSCTKPSDEPNIGNVSKLEACLVLVFQIGVSCSTELPSKRMNAREVLTELQKIRDAFLKL